MDIQHLNVFEITAGNFFLFWTRYMIFAGIGFVIFYKWAAERFAKVKIQPKRPASTIMKREILYSHLSMLIFSVTGGVAYLAVQAGYSKIYYDVSDYGYGYLIFSTVLLIVLHDAYFYWTHRWLHQPWLFKKVHRIHHLSTNPTPWAAFSFHPFEALVNTGIFTVMPFVIPIHPLALALSLTFMTAMNVLGHLGHELYFQGFSKHWLAKIMNTSTHHNLHHKRHTGNYGLYFNWWDGWCGTNRPENGATFEAVKERASVQPDHHEAA